MNKFWVQRQNILPEGMPQKITYQRRVMKDSIDLLNEEFKSNRNKEKLNNIKNNEFKRSSSSKIMDEVSPYAKTILLKIGKHIKKMKQSITDITKMNGLYLEEKAKNTYNQNAKKTIKKIKLKRSNSDIFSCNKTFNNNFDYLNNKKEKNKNEDFVNNFLYVNDNYRKQLNFAFLKFNPISHLDNLKILVEADPSIKKDISKINQEVEEDIKWKCDKYHFLKKYLNLLARNERSRSIQRMHEIQNKDNENNKDILFPKINDTNNKKNIKNNKKKIAAQKTVSSIYKQVNLFEKLNKKEMQKLSAQKEQTQEEIHHMLDASKEIDNLIQNENINNKIDMFKTDYAKQMYCYRGQNSESDNLLEKDYFMDEKKKIVEKIGNVYSFYMNKTANEKEKIFKGKIINENEKFRKKIIDGKKNTMDEFHTYIINNQINLPDKEIEDLLD